MEGLRNEEKKQTIPRCMATGVSIVYKIITIEFSDSGLSLCTTSTGTFPFILMFHCILLNIYQTGHCFKQNL
jgi:hypothetical protein